MRQQRGWRANGESIYFAGEMRLIGEAGAGGRLNNRRAALDHDDCPAQSDDPSKLTRRYPELDLKQANQVASCDR